MSTDNTDAAIHAKMQKRLVNFRRNAIVDPGLTPAAVAIVISPSRLSGGLSFLLTLRASRLSKHGGQFALPGGRVDSGESSVEAAARELKEELNVDSDSVIGLLDDYATRSGFCITPVVFWCSQLNTLKANPDEVAKVFHVPVADLGSEKNPVIARIPESPRPVLSVILDTIDYEVFSPTAAILHQFHEVLVIGNETRVADYDQPVFAWK